MSDFFSPFQCRLVEVFLLADNVIRDSPGRFFVAHELKMLVAYLLLNYDLKPLEERPPPSCIGRTMIPPTKATMEIKRKAGTSVTL